MPRPTAKEGATDMFDSEGEDDSLSPSDEKEEQEWRPTLASLRSATTTPTDITVTGSAYDCYMYGSDYDTTAHSRSAARIFLLCHAKNMASVFVMCIGIPEYDGILLREPFSLSKKKEWTTMSSLLAT